MISCNSNTKQIIYNLDISPAATAQLLVFNAIKRSRADSVAVMHNLDRETSSIVSQPAHPQQNTQTRCLYLTEDCQCYMTNVATLHGRNQYSN